MLSWMPGPQLSSVVKQHRYKDKRTRRNIIVIAIEFKVITSQYFRRAASPRHIFSLNMQISITTFLAATLAVVGTSASPIAPRNDSISADIRGAPWLPDHCDHSVIGVVAGTSYIQMLRNSWQLKFAHFDSTPFLDVRLSSILKYLC
jgi:hypothetical protein